MIKTEMKHSLCSCGDDMEVSGEFFMKNGLIHFKFIWHLSTIVLPLFYIIIYKSYTINPYIDYIYSIV